MALPADGQDANGLTKVTQIPAGKELMFIDPTTNEGGIITLEDLTKQILNGLLSQTFALDAGQKTIIQALNTLNSDSGINTYIGSEHNSRLCKIQITNNVGSILPSGAIIFGYEGVGILHFATMQRFSFASDGENIYGQILSKASDGYVLADFSDKNRQIVIIAPKGVKISLVEYSE